MPIFDYPRTPHRRRHGPRGYSDYTSYKVWLRDVLDLNDSVLARFRLEMARLVRRLRADTTPAGRSRLGFWLGLPDDLPDLSRLRPPAGNSRPGGLRHSYFARRSAGS